MKSFIVKVYDIFMYVLTEGRYIPPHLRNREATKGE